MFTIISQRFLVLCYYLQYLQYLQPLTNESFYTTSFALLAASACISSIFCKFSSIQLVHTDRLVLWMLTWLYFSFFQFIYFIQQHSVLTLQFTLFTYFIQYQISQAVFLRVNYWAGLSHIHLDDKVRRFSLYPPNVVRNCPNVRAVILSNNIIKYRGWR